MHNASISSFGDHRIAMAFIIAGLSAGNYNEIDDVEMYKYFVSEFFDILNLVVMQKNLQLLEIQLSIV